MPKLVASQRHEKYIKAFDNALIESLTTVGYSLKSGLTLKGGLEVAVKNCPDIFAQQVTICLKEYHFGTPIERALDNLRKRVGTQSANISFGALIIGTQLGGNIPDILKRIVSTIRDRQRVEGKLKSLTAQGRTQALLLCSAPPVIGILMYFWDPQKMALLTNTFNGQILLGLAIVLEVVGILATQKILKLEI